MNYLNEMVNLMPRVLSLLDRNRFSPTYGCFDRNYWHYKIITDYPSAIFQQGALSLALLYKNDFEGNIYYKNNSVLQWITAGLVFWSKVQNRDGSFNEWFPNEHSHVATAFSAYAVSETMLILGDELAPDIKQRLVNSLSLSGRWLKNNRDKLVINHTAGAVAALYNIYLLTEDEYFYKAVEENIDTVIRGQDKEGWFSEYGGADIGYLSVSIDYLAKYFKKTNDLRVKGILDKALNFLVYFVHPNGLSGGVYGNRNTRYLMPHGLVVLAPYFSNARYVLGSLWPRLGEQLNMFDDRYFIFFMFPNFIQANLEFKKEFLEYSKSDFSNYRKIFYSAGLVSIKTERYHLICNFKKGCVFNIFSKNKIVLSDAGYFGMSSKGKVFSSQWFGSNKVTSNDKETVVYVECPFILINFETLAFKNLFLLRVFNLTLGRIPKFAQVLNRYIKRTKIMKAKKMPIFLKRKMNIDDKEILVEDTVDAARANIRFNKFELGIDGTVMHVPSSGYFQKEILGSYIREFNLEKELNLKKRFKLSRRIRFTDDIPTPEISAEKPG